MNLSFLGPILVKFQYCGFLGLFWHFSLVKRAENQKAIPLIKSNLFGVKPPPPLLSYVYCINPTGSGVISRVGNFWVRCSALSPPCWGMMMKMLKRTTTRLLPDANFCPLKRPFWGTFYRSRSPCCVLLALSWNTTNENPSTDKLSRAID